MYADLDPRPCVGEKSCSHQTPPNVLSKIRMRDDARRVNLTQSALNVAAETPITKLIQSASYRLLDGPVFELMNERARRASSVYMRCMQRAGVETPFHMNGLSALVAFRGLTRTADVCYCRGSTTTTGRLPAFRRIV